MQEMSTLERLTKAVAPPVAKTEPAKMNQPELAKSDPAEKTTKIEEIQNPSLTTQPTETLPEETVEPDADPTKKEVKATQPEQVLPLIEEKPVEVESIADPLNKTEPEKERHFQDTETKQERPKVDVTIEPIIKTEKENPSQGTEVELPVQFTATETPKPLPNLLEVVKPIEQIPSHKKTEPVQVDESKPPHEQPKSRSDPASPTRIPRSPRDPLEHPKPRRSSKSEPRGQEPVIPPPKTTNRLPNLSKPPPVPLPPSKGFLADWFLPLIQGTSKEKPEIPKSIIETKFDPIKLDFLSYPNQTKSELLNSKIETSDSMYDFVKIDFRPQSQLQTKTENQLKETSPPMKQPVNDVIPPKVIEARVETPTQTGKIGVDDIPLKSTSEPEIHTSKTIEIATQQQRSVKELEVKEQTPMYVKPFQSLH